MVLVFSDNVNKSQAVLNEINIAAGADVTIVPFRIASVEFNPELHFYLGRVHWLDAFPQPIDTYIDALATTIRRNLPPPPPSPPPETTVAEVAPPPPAPPPPPPAPPPENHVVSVAPPPPKTDNRALIITGGVFALVVVLALLVSMCSHPRVNPPAPSANAAPANAADSDNDNDADDHETNTAPATAAPTGAQPPVGDGTELNAARQANPAAVNYYETVLAANGPPAMLAGATVLSTGQLIQNLRTRDAGTNPFWLIDARGCTTEPTIPTSVCLTSNTVQELEVKVPDKTAQLVIFCHDGACPLSYELASQAVAAGYTHVYWYRGGINAWMADGGPSVTQSEPAP
jgi:rhodanese-related sulfurtransferase